jgi:hypothetical protein
MSAPRYYLALDGKVSGPHGLDALRDMASVHAFTRDTLATREHVENWQPIHALPELADVLFPAAAKFQLKAKAVTLTADSVTPVSVEEILRDNLAAHARTAPPPDYTAQPSRPPGRARSRDYWIAMIACNALGLAAYFVLGRSAYTAIPLLAYFTMTNIGLYWVFFHVMDRY